MLPFASIISYLDTHQGSASVLLSAVLVLVTSFYAVQNARMVREMKMARRLTLLPKLALEFHRLGPTAMTVAIKNVGPGAALDIDVHLIYEPIRPGQPNPSRRWRQNVLGSGEQHDLLPPGETINNNINTLPATYRAITLRGTMKDATGATHEIEEGFSDLPEWREVLADAHQRWVAADPERRLAEELGKKIDIPTRKLEAKLDAIARSLYALRETPASDGDSD